MSNNKNKVVPRNGKAKFANKKQRMKNQLQNVEGRIYNNLMDGKNLSISSEKKPYISQETQVTRLQQKYKRLISQKQSKQRELQNLKNIQQQYANKLQKSQRIDNSSSHRSKSMLQKNDIKTLKKMRQKYNQFEKKLQQKTIEYQLKEQQAKIRQKQERQRKLLQQKQLRRIEVAKKIQQLNSQTIQRQKRIKSQNKKLKDINGQPKLFQQLDTSWQLKNQQQQKKKIQLMQQRMNQKKLDLRELKEHQKKYEQIMNEKKKQMNQRRMQMSRMSNKSSITSIDKSRYYTMVVKQERRAKRQEQKKKDIGKIIREKRLKYADYVKQEFAPRVKTPDEDVDDLQMNNRQRNTISHKKDLRLSPQQIKQIGNRNFLQAQKKAKKKQHKKTHDQILKQYQSEIIHYPDYLSEQRKKKEQNKEYDGSHSSPKDEAARIMKDQSMTKQQKITKIKMLADRFNAKTNDVVSKVMGKLQILEMIN